MKKWLSVAFICTYLGALSFGVGAHSIGFGITSHPAMYYIVWDMFCGWSAYSTRSHLIAEGVSGDYYRISPPPWGTFTPFGTLGREHYDAFNNHTGRIAMNTLLHTDHEEIARILVVEENWPKKFNLPDPIWNSWYEQPKDIQKYYQVRAELGPGGTVRRLYGSWIGLQIAQSLTDNPRLRNDVRNGKPFYLAQPRKQARSYLTDATGLSVPASSPVMTPSAN